MQSKFPFAKKSITVVLGMISLIAFASAETAKATATKARIEKTAAPNAASGKAPGNAVPTAAPTGSPSTANATAPSETPVTEETLVYLAKSGSRYHLKGCKYLKNSGKEVTILTAMKQGYAPCNVCKAPHLKRQ